MSPSNHPNKLPSSASSIRRSVLKTLAVNHTKLWIAVLVGVLVFVASPPNWTEISRLLTAWNAALLFYLPATYLWMRRLDSKQLRARYEPEDPTAPVILLIVVAAALLSVMSIVMLLSNMKQVDPADRAAHLALAALTIVNSWLLVPSLFTLHYADMFYSSAPQDAPLSFPNTTEPLFWDFVYFSFTIAAACQTADVSTNERGVRKLVVAQSIVAFFFNLSVLGLAVNVTAGLISAN